MIRERFMDQPAAWPAAAARASTARMSSTVKKGVARKANLQGDGIPVCCKGGRGTRTGGYMQLRQAARACAAASATLAVASAQPS